MMKKAIIVSGYFNPFHRGHLKYFMLAKEKGDYLIVIVNNDIQRRLKDSKEFMNEDERVLIVSNIKQVDTVYLSVDETSSVINTLQLIHNELKLEFELYFANGGDQDNKSIPEKNICDKLGIKLIDNLGDKIQSSSWLLKKNK